LHGNGPDSSGYWTDGPDLDFCVFDSEPVDIEGEKIKVPRALIVLRNKLPEGLHVGGIILR